MRNEAQFLALAIESHLPYLDELVIVYNACTDLTPEIATDYAQRFPEKVRVFHYEPEVFPVGTTEFMTLPSNSPHSLVNYSNYTLCQTTCRIALKVDGDHVAIPRNLARLTKIVRQPWLRLRYGFPRFNCALGFRGLNLWIQEGEFYVNMREPATEYVPFFPVSESTWFIHDPRWEIFHRDHLRLRTTEPYGFYHLKFLKRERDEWLRDFADLPGSRLFSDYNELNEWRIRPDLMPLTDYVAYDKAAAGLPPPSTLGILRDS